VTMLLVCAAPAHAGEVHKLKPWKASNTYLTERDFTLRTEQTRQSDKTVATAFKGNYLSITCQVAVVTENGPEIWDGVGGAGYAPDSVLKTYSDGRLEGSPTCPIPHPEHTWVNRAWSPQSQYRVEQAQSPQSKPHLGNSLGTTLETGQWVTIVCQTAGQKYGGSALWDEVGVGGYIPDSTLKTYTNGRIKGAPGCASTTLPPAKFAALGDSYSSGLGGDGYFAGDPPTALEFKYDYYANPAGRDPKVKDCSRNEHAYSRILASHLKSRLEHSVKWFLACQGDKTAEVLKYQVPRIPSNTRLITMTIGGNDMGFADIVAACVDFRKDCYGTIVKHFGAHNEKLAALGERLDRVYYEIRKKAPYATVVIAGYPQLMSGHPTGCGAIGDDDAKNLNTIAANLDLTIQQAVGRHQGFRFVDPSPIFKGHGPCQALGPNMWINPITPVGNRKPFSAHPNLRGQLAYAQAIQAADPDLFG
jgi:hypothetical protein